MSTIRMGDVSIHLTTAGDVVIDVKSSLKKPLHFTRTQAKILHVLFGRRGTVITPCMLALEVYPGKNAANLPEQKIIDVMVCMIRKKLKVSGLPDPITNVWGRGYRFGEAATPVPSALIPEDLQKPARWYAQRKEDVLSLIVDQESEREVLGFFTDLSPEELAEWRNLYKGNGLISLRATRAWLNA